MDRIAFSDRAFNFYAGLTTDNSKAYWEANKATYEAAVREPMTAMLERLAREFDGGVKLFRPYRDVRFTADKSPYKTAQGGLIRRGPGIGFYVQVDAEGVAVGGGFYARETAMTARYRAAVDDERGGRALVRIVDKLTSAGFTRHGEAVATRPRGVPADHPRLDLMRLKSLAVMTRPTDAVVDVTVVEREWRRVRPLVDWACEHVGT
ncbi:MAG TPA: DUF2461 domain-containing protein [Micromonosporaceae bacterium]|nr:DUF2461 domain-containing protein [Micromonosporaceae bacterium]